MDISQETQEKIARLQMLEQHIQSFSSQRQNFQLQMSEIDHALKELQHVKEKPFKVVGTIMISSDVEDLKKDLTSRKEVADIRIKNLEKQEHQLKEKAEALQKEVLGSIQQKRRE